MSRRKRLEAWAVTDADGLVWPYASKDIAERNDWPHKVGKPVRLVEYSSAEAAVVRAAVRQFKRTNGCDFDDCKLCQAVVRLLSERKRRGGK